MTVDVHQCPRCELRFATTAELQEHLTVDHAADPEGFGRYRVPVPPVDRRRKVLVVGNRSLDEERVAEDIAAVADGARVVLLVPASDGDVDAAVAGVRLLAALDHLHALGVDAEAEVGPPDAFAAAVRLHERHHFDEIVLSTLPPGLSHWLAADLPARLARRCHVPVRTLRDVVISGR